MAEIVQLVENGVKKFLKTHAKAVDGLYPVGSVYLSVNSENPSELFGGTWERFAQGKTLIGVDENDSEFETVEKNGGAKTQSYAIDDSKSRALIQAAGTALAGKFEKADAYVGNIRNSTAMTFGGQTNNLASGSVVTGQTKEENNMQPYITVYMWKRIA